MTRRLDPPIPLTNPAFKWVPAANTDLRAKWKRMGWRPPSEHRVIPLPLLRRKP